jgi:hypothetical protein
MNQGLINIRPCVTSAPPPNPLCSDPAYALANPSLCPPQPQLIITPEVAVACVLGSTQFKAYLQNSAGQTDVTANVVFSTSDPTIAVIGATSGSATGTGPGTAQVGASYQGMTAYAELTVMAGTDCCAGQTAAFMIVVDVTKSMSAAFGGNYPTREAFAVEAVNTLISALPGTAQIGLMTFTANQQNVLSGLTRSKAVVEGEVPDILQTTDTTGFTAALTQAVAMLNAATADEKVLVLISDGEDETASEFTPADDPIAVSTAFQQAGGIVICLGVRASSTDNGFSMLSNLSTGGFFINALPAAPDAALAYFTGLLGYFCQGDCTPMGDTITGQGELNFNGFQNWNVSGGNVDLIGNGFFDLLPGNDLYVDLGGTSAPHNGTMTTKDTFPVVAGHTYSLTVKLAGNQVDPADGMSVNIVLNGVASGNILTKTVISNYNAGFTDYSFSFTAPQNDSVYIEVYENPPGSGQPVTPPGVIYPPTPVTPAAIQGQIVWFNVDPTAESVYPADRSLAAFGYSLSGNYPAQTWNPITQKWSGAP